MFNDRNRSAKICWILIAKMYFSRLHRFIQTTCFIRRNCKVRRKVCKSQMCKYKFEALYMIWDFWTSQNFGLIKVMYFMSNQCLNELSRSVTSSRKLYLIVIWMCNTMRVSRIYQLYIHYISHVHTFLLSVMSFYVFVFMYIR